MADPLMTPGRLRNLFIRIAPDLIGTYTYKEGFVTEAIAIDNVPNDVEVNGIEIIIPGNPRLAKGVNRSSRRTSICQLWDIEFINHDSDKKGSLANKDKFFEIIQRCLLSLPRISFGTPIRQSDPVKSLQRYRLTLKYSDSMDNLVY